MSAVHVRAVVAGEAYGLGIEYVTEVSVIGDLTPVPGAPEFILGVCNLRGSVVAVASLAALLGVDATPEPGRVVVCESGSRRLALAVEDVTDVGSLPNGVQPTESALLEGTVLVDDVLVGIIDVPALIDAATPQAA